MKVYSLVLTTSNNDFDVAVYKDSKVPKKIIKDELKRIEGNDIYDILESTPSTLTYIDQEEDVVVEYKCKACEVE